MRSLRDTKKAIAKAPIRVMRQTNETVFKHLLGEFSGSRRDSAFRQMQTGLRITRRVACLATAAFIGVAAIWILHARHASQSHEPTQVATASPSGIALLTEISQERAYRRGGIQAVEDQCREALATSTKEPASPSFEGLLAELARDIDTLGGANL